MITAMTAPGAFATLAAQGTRRDWGWMQRHDGRMVGQGIAVIVRVK